MIIHIIHQYWGMFALCTYPWLSTKIGTSTTGHVFIVGTCVTRLKKEKRLPTVILRLNYIGCLKSSKSISIIIRVISYKYKLIFSLIISRMVTISSIYLCSIIICCDNVNLFKFLRINLPSRHWDYSTLNYYYYCWHFHNLLICSSISGFLSFYPL